MKLYAILRVSIDDDQAYIMPRLFKTYDDALNETLKLDLEDRNYNHYIDEVSYDSTAID